MSQLFYSLLWVQRILFVNISVFRVETLVYLLQMFLFIIYFMFPLVKSLLYWYVSVCVGKHSNTLIDLFLFIVMTKQVNTDEISTETKPV